MMFKRTCILFHDAPNDGKIGSFGFMVAEFPLRALRALAGGSAAPESA